MPVQKSAITSCPPGLSTRTASSTEVFDWFRVVVPVRGGQDRFEQERVVVDELPANVKELAERVGWRAGGEVGGVDGGKALGGGGGP